MSVGATLSEARVRAGLSLDEVAASTCIRRTLVEDIERDDYHACGGVFYARGHVKSIAQAVHLDPGPLLAEFDAAHHDPEAPTASGVLDVTRTSGSTRAAEGRRPNWTAAMAVALLLVLGFGAYHLLSGGTKAASTGGSAAVGAGAVGSTRATTSDPSSPSSTAPSSTATPTVTGTAPGNAIADAPSGGVTVVLSAVSGKSWVSATGKDNGVLYQSILASGQQQTLRDGKQVTLVLGNAGAVDLLVNGKDLGSPGGQGQVVHLTFGPGDPSLAAG